MITIPKNIHANTWLAAASLLSAAFLIQCFTGAKRLSLTWDEPSFISAGYIYLTESDFRLNRSHPPLMQELEALPLLLLDLRVPEWPGDWLSSVNPVVNYGHALIYQSGNDPLKIALLARLPVMILGAALVLAMFLWGRNMFGPGPALAAAALASVCPNLLAHAKLATEDLGCSTFFFFASWSFWNAARKRTIRNWAICGFLTGVALLSKYTALLLFPTYLLLSVWLILRKDDALETTAMVKGLAVTGSVAIIVVGAGYNFTFAWESYLRGITEIYQDLHPSWNFYLLGKISEEPRWYFNLVGLATKTPLPTLMLIGLAAAVCSWKDRSKFDQVMFLLVPAALIIAVSFFDKANLGLRRILPAVPFLLLFTANALTGSVGRARRLVVVALIVWSAVESALIYPFHLSYFNFLAGGPERGPYLFEDSNVDWGQDLPSLASWQKSHPDSVPLSVSYFGTASPRAYGVVGQAMAEEDILDPKPGRVYAISAHHLVYFRKVSILTGQDADWLSKYTPVDRAGYSIYIYKF